MDRLLNFFAGLALITGLLAGCASESPAPKSAAVIPWDDIKTLLNPRQRTTLESLQYTGYVILDAWVQDDGIVRVNRVTESFPDGSRDALAVAFAKKAVIRTQVLGSRISPTAVVYVVFYDHKLEGDIALTFARPREWAGTVRPGSDYYLNVVAY